MSRRDHVGADPTDGGGVVVRRRRSRSRVLAIDGLGAAVALLAVWSERTTIGTAVIDRKLAAAHVRARYRIVDLGLGRQRLVDVRIGDPARPDLVADWIELRTRIGLDGAAVTAVSAGGLRVRASVVSGKLSLGEIDRLLPTATGGAVRLPAIDLSVRDARAFVVSPFGAVRLSLSGDGRLDGGFRGRVTAASDRMAASGCVAPTVVLASAVRTDRGAMALQGPIRAGRLVCRGVAVERPFADVDVTLAEGLSSWRGMSMLRADRAAAAGAEAQVVRGRVTFAGRADGTAGDLMLRSGPVRAAGIAGGGLAVNGRYRLGAEPAFVGKVAGSDVVVPDRLLAVSQRMAGGGAGTPIGPLLAQASAALARAGQDFDLSSELAADRNGVALSRAQAKARSGARASFVADAPVRIVDGRLSGFSGTAQVSGGGLPTATIRAVRSWSDGPVRGVATIAPYAAGEAQLALAPVRFAWDGAGGQIATVATLSGPLGDGRVEGLRVPVAAVWDGAGVRLGSVCTTVAFERLAIASLRLAAAAVPVCGSGASLIELRGGGVAGALRIPTLRLDGKLGGSPVTLAAEDTRVTLADRRLVASRVAARLGEGEAATRLDVARLSGSVAQDGLAGRIEGAGGRIGKVPLLLSDGTGEWRFAKGTLTLAADATVSDASAPARFEPLRAEAIRLRLADDAIAATAALVAPGGATRVADVAIDHDLRRGAGAATLAVRGLAFTEGFQPDALTPLTFGVIADVRGTISGDARIGWTPDGVTSTGVFRTDGLDFAAAFGPVRGLAGTIRFTDLLRLESAPGQIATVASVNPGVPVEDGRIVYRLLPDARIEVAGGRWPFAGGSLELRPTTLTFGAPAERRLTFVLDGVDAGRFLQQFDFDNLTATGTFDGTLPMIFDASGGRIEGGELRVRRGGGNLAYLGELTQKDLGTWGNIAFQALRSIDYRDLRIVMNGPLAGEMITEVRFAGISQGKGAKSNFLIRRLQKLPFVFNIRIEAPFRGLIDSAQSFYDPSRLIERNLPALLRAQGEAVAPPPAIQPGASERRP